MNDQSQNVMLDFVQRYRKEPAIWEQKWIGGGSTDVKYTKSYEKMKMRFV